MSAVTVINSFEVPAGREGEFLELWGKVNAYMQRKPGYLDVHAAARQLRFNGLRRFDGPEIGRDGKNSLDVYDPDGFRRQRYGR